jgi:hypothetical protein
MHFDLTALAFRADITRVATLLGARDLTGRSYNFPKGELFPQGGVSVGFHGGSHHQDDPAQIKRYSDLNRYHVSTLGYLAEKLRSIPDGDGTLLDHSLILYGTNGQFESASALRRAAHPRRRRHGQLGSRHIAFERKTVTTGNLLLSVLRHAGSARISRATAQGGWRSSSGALHVAVGTEVGLDEEFPGRSR